MVTADAGQRVALARGVWLRLQAALGDANLRTVSALVAYARYTPEASEAAALLASACRTLDEMHPELIGERIYCESYRAFLTEELGEDLTARRIHDRIVELGAGSTDAEARWRAAQASCHAQLLRGAPEAAIIELTPWASVYSNSPRWWLRVRAADTALCLGEAKHLLGRNRDAARDLGLAKEIYAHVIQLNEEVEFRRKLALADRLLGAVQRSIVRAHGIDASPAETVSRVPKQIRERTVTGIH
ncbi:MAG TPA: hypothetical protein VFT22_07765 [Kofleriaceae bacterium]|nr:hypothetical protein [Kofleriaceae bacterium]